MRRDGLPLALPLAALFAVAFVAPLCVLIAMSLSSDAGFASFTAQNYVKFFTDRFNYSILVDTLLLGVKATALCLLFGFPIAWVASRSSPRVQSILLFIVVLPIMTSVVVRTFAWIVILGRQGLLNQIVTGLGLSQEPLRLLYSEAGVVLVLAQVQMPLMVLPILTVISRIDPNLSDASRALESWVRHYFGDTAPGAATARFEAAIATLMERWDEWHSTASDDGVDEPDDEVEED